MTFKPVWLQSREKLIATCKQRGETIRRLEDERQGLAEERRIHQKARQHFWVLLSYYKQLRRETDFWIALHELENAEARRRAAENWADDGLEILP